MSNIAAIAEPRNTPTSAINTPDITVKAREVFGIDVDLEIPAFSVRTEHVPEIDPAYQFDKETTLAILAGFAF
ncbi:MAG TPA: cobaltochelatase subunit CobS, partial [Acidocella sp.]|nr:cobaltochelatase subunit CobS [Acidocella sp.]